METLQLESRTCHTKLCHILQNFGALMRLDLLSNEKSPMYVKHVDL